MTSPPTPPLPPRAQAYLNAAIQLCNDNENLLASLILFGSAAIGGFSETVSDVDLIFVLHDTATPADRSTLRNNVSKLEILYGFHESSERRPSALEVFFEKVSANQRSFLVCTRKGILSRNVAQILNVSALQGAFVDRVVIPSILSCARTVWRENLLLAISPPPIRRLDVFKALGALANQVAISALLFPLLRKATKYSMAALKGSVHSCYFCHHARRAALQDEVDFFLQRYGTCVALDQLLALRSAYAPSFAFVLRCLPAIARLHLRTAMEVQFHK